MDFKVGMKYHGFTVDRIRDGGKAGGEFIEMTHDATGARLCYSKNSEENKLFSVAFRTIPEDSTGVFHILEHSVLCGSDKYPVKEPFVELLKSSMNTFLNAMTYPDKTVYPVSSRNEKDFLNLAGVYLDAVFAPCLLTNKNVFLQEGRHLEVKDGVPQFNGVVLNEMRGATSEADDRLEEALGALLFPDNCYRHNSGGDPFSIPRLTYEKYVGTYRRFYHPSNSYFYLDGAIPEEETFALIESYLAPYTASPVTTDVAYQEPKSAEGVDYYGTDDPSPSHDILATAKIFADFTKIDRIFAANVLCDYLASTNESPLKRAVLASGLAEDVDVTVNEGIKQPYVSTVVRNMADADSEKIKALITETLEKIAAEGLSRKDLTASLNKFEFSFRQMPEPKGLFRNIIALDSWLYGGDPMEFLDTEGVFVRLREMIEDGGYDALLREIFIDKTGEVTLHLKASTTFAEEVAKGEAEYAAKVYSEMTDAEKAAHKEEIEKFDAWQATGDTPEGVATIPVLPISEVSPDPEKYEIEESAPHGVKTVFHKTATNGIVYFNVYAPLTEFTLDELTTLSIAPSLLGQLPTKSHTLSDLQREIKTYLGDFSASLQIMAKYGQTATCRPMMVVSASALGENLEKAEELVSEIISETIYDDASRVHEIVKQIDEGMRQRIVAAGHRFALSAARASLSSEGAATEATGGVTALRAVKELNSSFAEKYPAVKALIARAFAQSFTKENVTVGVTAEHEVDLSRLVARLESGKTLPDSATYKSALPLRSSVKTPSQVSFAVTADSLEKSGTKNSGSHRVAANLLSLSYLWNAVRVKGGAYGTGISVAGNGTMFCYSFRDPNPANSLAAYGGAADFLEEFARSGESLDKYIISTVAAGDPLKTPREEGAAAEALYLSGLTYDERRKTREEMLKTTPDDLLALVPALRHMAKEGTVSVVGGIPVEGLEIIDN